MTAWSRWRSLASPALIPGLGDRAGYVCTSGNGVCPHADLAHSDASHIVHSPGQAVYAGRQQEPEPTMPGGNHGLRGRRPSGGHMSRHEQGGRLGPDRRTRPANRSPHHAVRDARRRAAAGSVRLSARPRSGRGLLSCCLDAQIDVMVVAERCHDRRPRRTREPDESGGAITASGSFVVEIDTNCQRVGVQRF